MKSGFLLAGLILALWPGSLSSPGFFGPPVLLVAGGGDVNYLAVARGPERVPDVAGSSIVAQQRAIMAVVDMSAVESETEAQTRATNHTGTSDWAGEAPAAGNRLRQPSTRGGLRIWVTHYAAEDICTAEQIRRDQCITASGHPLRVGYAAGYPVRDEDGQIMSANLRIDGMSLLPFGTRLAVAELGEVTIMDTGDGMPDGRPWLDVSVSTRGEAIRLGAGWREVTVLEGG